MQETMLNSPLSGKEVREAILFDIRKVLESDDRFSAHIAYDAFKFKATLAISLPSGVQTEIEREIIGGKTMRPGEAIAAEEEVRIAERSLNKPDGVPFTPNDVRFDTDQPLHFLVTDDKGNTTEKLVSYAGKDRMGRPKGGKQIPDAPPSVEKVKRNVVKGIDA